MKFFRTSQKGRISRLRAGVLASQAPVEDKRRIEVALDTLDSSRLAQRLPPSSRAGVRAASRLRHRLTNGENPVYPNASHASSPSTQSEMATIREEEFTGLAKD